MYYKDNRIIKELPAKIELDDKIIFKPKWSHFEAAGWKVFPSELEAVQRRFIKWVNGEPVEMTQQEKDSLLAADIEQKKKQMILDIDSRTRELINEGFEFDGNTFSLSPNAQNMFTGVSLAIQKGFLTESDFPYEITTLDDKAYMLSWADADTFFGLVLFHISQRLAAGRSIKVQVVNATTIEELNLIADNR
jgi:hypothetical protein